MAGCPWQTVDQAQISQVVRLSKQGNVFLGSFCCLARQAKEINKTNKNKLIYWFLVSSDLFRVISGSTVSLKIFVFFSSTFMLALSRRLSMLMCLMWSLSVSENIRWVYGKYCVRVLIRRVDSEFVVSSVNFKEGFLPVFLDEVYLIIP